MKGFDLPEVKGMFDLPKRTVVFDGVLQNRYRFFDGRRYEFYYRGTKREVDREAKLKKEFGYNIRRTKSKRGWNLWISKRD